MLGRVSLAALLVALVIVGGFADGRTQEAPGTPGASPEASPEASPGATPEGAVIQLEAYDIGWRTADQPGPTVELTVAPGATIELVNTGAAAHNFQAEDLGINQDMAVGFTGTVTIPADAAPGTYDFICNVPGHAAAGMTGTLTIQ